VISLKRAYEPVSDEDGQRILVDRLWPRGVSKERIAIVRWAKELSPSAELCKWFDHDPAKWAEFQRRYEAELSDKRDALQKVADAAQNEMITLVYGAKDEQHNQALVLRQVLEKMWVKS